MIKLLRSELIKDINSLGSGAPRNLTKVNNVSFFAANSPVIVFDSISMRIDTVPDTELWKTDGTPEGTILVKDINPGVESSFPDSFLEVDGILFFTADDGIHGRELWMSDGTREGTVLVKDINPAGSSAPISITEFDETIFFNAIDEKYGKELWKLNGDFQPPRLNSITRQEPLSEITNADTLIFRATFSEEVQNVSSDNFIVIGTTASIDNIKKISGNIYDINLTGGDISSLNDTVGLELKAYQNIIDLSGQKLSIEEPMINEVFILKNSVSGADVIYLPSQNSSNNNASKFILYPNPVYNDLIHFHSVGINEIEIFDLKGNKISHFMIKDGQTYINLHNYQNGFYIFKLSTGTSVFYNKLMILD